MSKRNHRPAWTPLQRAKAKPHPVLDAIPGMREALGDEIWMNSRYVVHVHRREIEILPGVPQQMVALSVRNLDRSAKHDWRDFQRIKNELCGVEEEAVELYPRESGLVDTANQYWLWCIPGCHAPFGFRTRLVSEGTGGIGAQQRPWEPDNRPTDLKQINVDDLKAMAKKEFGNE